MRLDFLIELTWRRIFERYVGTTSRLAWVFVSPVLPMLVSILVFYFIARVPQIQEMGLATYAAFMFSGLLPFRVIQRTTVESCDLIIGNMEMLKTTVFPLPYLTLSLVGALLFEFLIQYVVMGVLLVVSGTGLTWKVLLLPVAIAILFFGAVGMSWLMSVLGAAARDLQEALSMGFSGLIYLTPIMFPPEAAPLFLQKLIWLNPITAYVHIFRDALMPSPEGLHFRAWLAAVCCSAGLLVAGWYAIQKAQDYVGDMV